MCSPLWPCWEAAEAVETSGVDVTEIIVQYHSVYLNTFHLILKRHLYTFYALFSYLQRSGRYSKFYIPYIHGFCILGQGKHFHTTFNRKRGGLDHSDSLCDE